MSLQDKVQVCWSPVSRVGGPAGGPAQALGSLWLPKRSAAAAGSCFRCCPLSHTLRPTFSRGHATPASGATFDFPQNSFVWENKKIDSRPYKPSAKTAAPLELGQEGATKGGECSHPGPTHVRAPVGAPQGRKFGLQGRSNAAYPRPVDLP